MRLKLKIFGNPYILFAVSWTLCLGLYALKWALIFPPLKIDLLIFILILIIIFGATGLMYKRLSYSPKILRIIKTNQNQLLIINIILFLPNFVYSGIPIINGLRDADFGIPTLKVFAVSFNGFVSVYYFYLFLLTAKRKYLLNVLLCLMLFVLIISRGYVVMSLISMFFLWLNVKRPILTLKKVAIIFCGALIAMYLFGVAGNYRTIKDIASYNNNFDTHYNSDIILQIGQASNDFKKSIVPGEFFWSYLYFASPLSNLQYNVSQKPPELTLTNFNDLIINEVFFDFISKRIDDIYKTKHKLPELVVNELTVCTFLAGSYIYAGWLGMVILSLILWIIPFIYMYLIKNNPIGIIGISILCTIFFFSIFDNMLILSPLSIQLFFPLILGKGVLFNKS